MKKRILITLLCLLCAICSIACGDPKESSQAPSQGSSVEQSSSLPEDSSVEEKVPNVIERVQVDEVLAKNVETATLKDVYMLCEGDAYIVGDVFNGIALGDLALYALGEMVDFNYYDDGKWYSVDNDGNLKPFNYVLSVIFEYKIGSGKPLGFSEAELTMMGSTAVITYFESQFGIEITSILNNPPAELESLLPAGITSFLSRCLEITVRDLYNVTNGDYSYFEEFIQETDVDEITNLVFDVLEFDSTRSYVKLRALLIKTLNGKLLEITVDENVTVNSIVEAYFENTTEYTAFEKELRKQLMAVYGFDVTVGQLLDVTMALDIDTVIANLASLVKTVATEEEAQMIADAEAELKAVLSGTLGEIKLEVNGEKVKQYITELLGATVEGDNAIAFVEDLSNAVAQLLNGSAELIDYFVTKYESLTLNDIDGYLGGAISKFVTDSGYEWGEISTVKVADLKKIIDEINNSANGDIGAEIEKANGDVVEIAKILNDFINKWIDVNQESTIKELLKDYVTVDGELGDLKIGEIFDKKLFSLDDLILNGALYELMNGTGVEDLLTALTVNDLYSILTLNASQEALDALDEIDLFEVFALIEKINEQSSVEQVK